MGYFSTQELGFVYYMKLDVQQSATCQTKCKRTKNEN